MSLPLPGLLRRYNDSTSTAHRPALSTGCGTECRARRFHEAVAKALDLQTKTIADESFVLAKSEEEPIPCLWIGTLRPSC